MPGTEEVSELETVLGILQGVAFFIALPVLIGFMIIGSLLLWARFKAGAKTFAELVCSTNADCPKGYVCENGVCIPVRR